MAVFISNGLPSTNQLIQHGTVKINSSDANSSYQYVNLPIPYADNKYAMFCQFPYHKSTVNNWCRCSDENKTNSKFLIRTNVANTGWDIKWITIGVPL